MSQTNSTANFHTQSQNIQNGSQQNQVASTQSLSNHQQQTNSSSGVGIGNHNPPQIDAEETDKVVGYGAFGVVWSVTDPRSGRRVALKKMPNVFQTVVSAKRVFREVKMLCTLKHENVNIF